MCYTLGMLYEKRLMRMESTLRHKQPDLQLFCEDITSSQNLSAIMRTCEAVGVLYLYYSTKSDADLKVHKTISQGAHRWIVVKRIAYHDKEAFVLQKKAEGFLLLVSALEAQSKGFRDVDYTSKVVLIMGNEKEGVSQALQSMADATIMIPMQGMVQSLNISVATAVILYEAQRQLEACAQHKTAQLSQEERDLLQESWLRRDVIIRRSKGKINK